MTTEFPLNDPIRQREDLRQNYGRSDSDTSDLFRTKTRSTTDVCFLLFFTIFLIVLLCFVGYCMFNGDIFRIINGYDNCGYICNRPITLRGQAQDDYCYRTATVSEPYHIVLRNNYSTATIRKCVADCNDYEGYRKFFNRCVPIKNDKVINTLFSKTGLSNFFEEVSEDFQLCWPEFVYLCLIALAFSICMLVLFRFLVGIVVWVVLVGVILAFCVGTVILWILWDQSRKEKITITRLEEKFPELEEKKTSTFLILAIASTIITLVIILVIIVMRKRIQLVVQLFKEAGKALASLPLILFQPFLTFVAVTVVLIIWFYFVLWIESSGNLTLTSENTYHYLKNGWHIFTRWYNVLGMLWMCQFLIGCQHMTIAGAVSTWYFAKNKSNLGSPIFTSFYNLVRYHLGSVALGSFLIAIVQFVRILLKVVETYLNTHRGKCIDCTLSCCNCCLYCFEKMLKYLSRNAYVEIATYGYSFCRGAKQAFRLLVTNVLRVTAINSVGDFVLFLGKILVVIATVLIGIKMLNNKEGIQRMWVPLTLAGLFAYLVAHCFMTVYEMVIDTIFLCFCEDCEQNDGINRPYYMSRGLMEFVENSKKALEIHDYRQRQAQAWQPSVVPTISGRVNKDQF